MTHLTHRAVDFFPWAKLFPFPFNILTPCAAKSMVIYYSLFVCKGEQIILHSVSLGNEKATQPQQEPWLW
jgi:hypothetical protein